MEAIPFADGLFSLRITIPVTFELLTTGVVHGLAFWFDVAFIGSE